MWNRKHTNAKAHIKDVINKSTRNPKLHKADVMEDHVDRAYETYKPVKRSDMIKEHMAFQNNGFALEFIGLPFKYDTVNGKTIVHFMSEYSNLKNYEILEHGYLMSTNRPGEEITLETPSTGKRQFNDNPGGYTYTFPNSSGVTTFSSRGYVKYKDASGETKVLYTDRIDMTNSVSEPVKKIAIGE